MTFILPSPDQVLSDWYFTQMLPSDYVYMQLPRRPPECTVCGSVYAHSDQCAMLLDHYVSITKCPFGKHKGKKMVDVPLDYVVWMVKADVEKGILGGKDTLREVAYWLLRKHGKEKALAAKKAKVKGKSWHLSKEEKAGGTDKERCEDSTTVSSGLSLALMPDL